MAKTFSESEIRTHNTDKSTWITIEGSVFDVTKFAMAHPGGEKLLKDYGGKDATDAFNAFHRRDVLNKYSDKLKLGEVEGAKVAGPAQGFGDISKVPFAEAPFWRGMRSPFHNESHQKFRTEVRAFVDKELRAVAEESEDSGEYPTKEIYQKMGQFGLLASRIAHGPHLKGMKLPAGVTEDTFDYFHEAIAHEEVARLSCPGFIDGLGAGYVIGVSPVLVFGSPAMRETVGKAVLMGEKRICLAISEPAAGSDVAGILTSATKSADGSKYIVNGVKKWITNGCFADYFVTAVRTGGKGMGGISLLLVERDDGVETKPIQTSYAPCAGTAYVMYEDVEVPCDRILGKENQGFACIMYNFNHERWFIVCQVVASSRFVLEECFKWTAQRMVFGKPLVNQPVIREKLARMVSELESVTAWLENVTFQMQNMSYKEQQAKLAGPTALLKYQVTRVAHNIADDACQIFGGRAITKTGMGKYIERFQRTYKFGAILGGSEEIMADLGIKQAMRDYPSNAKL